MVTKRKRTHGGPRKGAGRRPGAVAAPAKLAQAIAPYIGEGPGTTSMLDIIQGAARHFWMEANKADAKLAALAVGDDLEDFRSMVLAEAKKAVGVRALAARIASDAARYLHTPAAAAPLNVVQAGETIPPLIERMRYYIREDAIEASGKVVDLKGKRAP